MCFVSETSLCYMVWNKRWFSVLDDFFFNKTILVSSLPLCIIEHMCFERMFPYIQAEHLNLLIEFDQRINDSKKGTSYRFVFHTEICYCLV